MCDEIFMGVRQQQETLIIQGVLCKLFRLLSDIDVTSHVCL